MAEELTYKDEAAAGYDRAFARVTTHFVPHLLRAAHIAPGMRVLDIAAGTGLAAEAALKIVGPTGHVTAADLSSAMVEKSRERLGQAKNVSVAVEDGQALSFPDESFDAVVCSLGLMFFPDALRGLAEFRRVLRPGGRAAVSVNTVPERCTVPWLTSQSFDGRWPEYADASHLLLPGWPDIERKFYTVWPQSPSKKSPAGAGLSTSSDSAHMLQRLRKVTAGQSNEPAQPAVAID